MDAEFGRFDVRAISAQEIAQQQAFAKNMLFAAIAASLAIVGASAFFIALFL